MRQVTNPRNDTPMAHSEVEIGSVPVGSWVELYDLEDVLVYRGWVRRQSPWGGYTVVEPVTEGDGNFIGSAESGTLQRLYSMSDRHYVQEHAPCRWLGVDEGIATVLEQAIAGQTMTMTNGAPAVGVIALSPVVSLVPEEVDDDASTEDAEG